eukprot:362866-Chlamydomonas_euryale.AAC.16
MHDFKSGSVLIELARQRHTLPARSDVLLEGRLGSATRAVHVPTVQDSYTREINDVCPGSTAASCMYAYTACSTKGPEVESYQEQAQLGYACIECAKQWEIQ